MPKEGDINNPNGKGGFADNPQNRANGRWSKDTSISYWYNHLIRLDLLAFKDFKPSTMAQDLAYKAVIEAQEELNYLKEITDRTEGRANQQTDITTNGKELNFPNTIQVEIVQPDED
jgi:predicted component of type VI protein secretion system